MEFNPPLIAAQHVKRYKRFFLDAQLQNGDLVTAHCVNTGPMISCNEPGRLVMLSKAINPTRKLAYTYEMIKMDHSWVGTNTSRPNTLVEDAILAGQIKQVMAYSAIKREVRYGAGSRIDLLLTGDGLPDCYIEVKNATMLDPDGVVRFPDAVTTRGKKHLEELARQLKNGHRAIMFFVINREEPDVFEPADRIDPEYGRSLRLAADQGVEIIAYRCTVTPSKIEISHQVKVNLS